MEVVGAFLGHQEDAALLRCFQRHHQALFPNVSGLHRTSFSRQAASAACCAPSCATPAAPSSTTASSRSRSQAAVVGRRVLFWEDGYFVRTVRSQVTAEVIKNYIQRHQQDKDDPQLSLF